MSARRVPVNLLPKSEFELSYWGRFLKWALGTGRYIIILTEIVVIGAFLSRFKFDQDLADLTDSANNKQEILKHTVVSEENFRTVQKRLNAAARLLAQQNKPSKTLDDIAMIMPASMRLVSVSVADQETMVSAQAAGELEVGAFLSQLANQTNSNGTKKWKSITLNELSKDTPAVVKFSFTASY
jgi:hypothetical protein